VTSPVATTDLRNLLLRLAAVAVAGAALVGAAGRAIEHARFGPDDLASVARIEAELIDRFETSAETLGALAVQVAGERDLVGSARRDPGAASALFDALAEVLSQAPGPGTGISVYGPVAVPVAWTGRVSDLPRERIEGPAALFVAPGALGPRLVRVEPLVDPGVPGTPRQGSVVVEQLLGQGPGQPGAGDTFVLSTSLVTVRLRAQLGATAGTSPYSIAIRASDGQLLVEAQVSPEELAAARGQWRRGTTAAVLVVLALALLVAARSVAETRRSRRGWSFVLATIGVLGLLMALRLVLGVAVGAVVGPRPWTSPLDLTITAVVLAASVWLAIDTIERIRLARGRWRIVMPSARTLVGTAGLHALAGAMGVAVMWGYLLALERIVSGATFDLLHFSSYPLDAGRLALAFALVLLQAAVVWGAAAPLRLAAVVWRRPRSTTLTGAALAGWMAGLVVGSAVAFRGSGAVPLGPLIVGVVVSGACATVLGRPHGSARRASQTARLAALYLALLAPTLALYPALHAFAVEAKERLVAESFSPQAADLRDDLQDNLRGALEAIDALPSLAAFVPALPRESAATTDQAFQVWSNTELATFRLTSAVELYGPEGRLVSRFALALPEYAASAPSAVSCVDWDILDEVSPFGSSERHVLRASRAICERGRRLGAIVVRAMLDYRTLPFISSRSPYLQALTAEQPPVDAELGRGVEFVVYGWSRAPIYASGTSVWPLPDPVFEAMVASRASFWATLPRDGDSHRVYFINDRGGIYALGYPVITGFGHLVNLAELVAVSALMYALLLMVATASNALVSQAPASGRALLREVRSSFYRKLFLAFVAAAVVPVMILAVATRAYFATQFRGGVEEAARQTATVAQRLVEDYATLQRQGGQPFELLDDQIMVLVGRAIDQAVNLFDGTRLQATSERDLFASRLLPTRTPADVYRSIVLQRMPTFVGEEEVGGLRYLVAAAPVRAGGSEGVVTVPQTLRQREIEQQIDELDRRVLFAALSFVLLGAALGYWMAERIADPVNRLTRATRRIARGDLDARIAATSSDELRRLVEDFNQMADDLKRQRAELERTQRLEAWADMARQVAHDIKNPLTPIQLSAEHARRVNIDRGRPLSPVLDDCVNAILNQVKLLRQISAEFSSFASSPTASPEPTHLGALIEEVVSPYRTGLSGRVSIDVAVDHDVPTVSIDRTLFARALTNVIENALHAMAGRGRLTITARRSGAVAGSPLVVQIGDTGAGMDPDAIARVFEPYFSTKASGTGLGLTIAKRNIELIGGTIAVESERGVGTTVTFTLPGP
jgi:signal transduction histidine kinase